jgi:hypothetical protein
MLFKDVCGTGKKQISFAEVPLADATRYAAEDAEVTWRLHQLAPRLSDEGGTRVYQRVDRPLVPVAQMERHGIRVDREVLAGLSSSHRDRPAGSGDPREGGRPFTIGSPKQLGDVLFDKLGYKGGKRARAGSIPPTSRCWKPWPGRARKRLVLEWRQLSKLKSTYTDALQAAINPDTGGCTPVTAWRRRPGGFRPTIPTCRTSRSAPRSGARSARLSWPSRGMRAAERGLFADPAAPGRRIADVACCARRSSRARTFTPAPRASCSAK